MDSDDDVRRWACTWMVWRWRPTPLENGSHVSRLDGDYFMSDADLAEAVRVELKKREDYHGDDGMTGHAFDACVNWFCDGPIAFMRAVKEVVDGQA
jgi:hypothetical protein